MNLKKTIIILSGLLLLSCPPSAPAVAGSEHDFLKEINRRHYPQAHAVLAAEIEERSYQADGAGLTVDEVFLTVLDEEGRRRHQELSFYANQAYGRLRIELCEIIRAGRQLPIDVAANSRTEASAANSRANIYNPQEKIIKLVIPGLAIGDTIHYRLRRYQFKPIISRQIYGQVLAQYDIPIKSYQLSIETPAEKKVNWLIKDEIRRCVRHEQIELPGSRPRRLLRWHFTDVDQIVPEEYMPSFRRVAMRLLYSSLDQWNAIAAWYSDLVEPRLKLEPGPSSFVDKLCSDLSRERKISKLFFFVAREIRYLGVTGEDERPGFEPHDVNLTFTRRHGVCRDKAALLVAMLRRAGFKAVPVLIRVGDRLDPEIALPYFNHAIVAVYESPEQIILLDPTAETTRQFLPDYERECSYLPADRQSGRLRETPSPDPDANLTRIVIDSHYHHDGLISGRLSVDCHGFADALLRSIMMNLSARERKNFLHAFFLSRRPGLELLEPRFSDPADRERSFSFSGHFSYRPDNNSSVLIPLAFMADPGPLESRLLTRADLSRRRFPLDLGYTMTTEVLEHSSWDKGLIPPLPMTMSINNPVLSFELKSNSTPPNRITYQRRFTLKKTEAEAADYHFLTEWQNLAGLISRGVNFDQTGGEYK